MRSVSEVLNGKHIILGISGGIAAYKSVTLLRLFVKAGAEVQVVITPNGKEFITPVTLSSLSGKPVISEFFTANTGEWHSHVDLGMWADAMIIAPATASTIGKMANGIADNMLVTTYLSAKEQVFVAPAMDLDMMAHPTTQRNIETLKRDGVIIIDSASGELASHLTGKGRMEEPENILQHVIEWFEANDVCDRKHSLREYGLVKRDLSGKRIMITAGPTYENIDPVRFIGNYSTGKMGFSLAEAAAERGAEVELIAGPVSLDISSDKIHRTDVRSAQEMLSACMDKFADCDCAILCAAVSDYTPEVCSDTKLKREHLGDFTLKLKKNPDIAATLGACKGDKLLIGFALETDNEEQNAIGKVKRKNLDWIVLNSLRDPDAGFARDTNHVRLISRTGDIFAFGVKPKREVADDILDTVFG
ncbi:MAG: bifunctional phosphopantothenoylcysteine decarboxylase/phosphopantothenate--cysteine ligase CoaBC [Prevotella sp.]|nr:bifunctional phosphopantothenoylcysteine decarboxylase/phosphopantothenate--cysteine ligase CoaBC [Bacteroides sp.]MCM1365683.1 bifunctional phosphopantothenoylcysteine decarboxylase/phosphopantothenate--cysteine ligase CoaBC [Prevotella sp.]MCM1437137.1 bifunctional phosphopantothenoylcysteine decarboxylase/phosphopantothenate--cysteine ligase CoaBC [Prevotella sp.]